MSSSLLQSSVFKKFIMGLTGLMLAGFVFAHMAGNMLIFVSADAYNLYGESITGNPLYPLIGPGLLGIFIVHILMALWITKDNKAARGKKAYQAGGTQGAKAVTLASRTMIYSGALIAAFLVSHLLTFKYGVYYSTVVDGKEVRDLARLMYETFQNPMYVLWYVISLVFLALHLKHGFAAAFQSLGFAHPKYIPALKCLAVLYALVVGIGFASQPLYVFFRSAN
jgi:succinate dehydrogenase / fumarate reductase cytochrome b subunit